MTDPDELFAIAPGDASDDEEDGGAEVADATLGSEHDVEPTGRPGDPADVVRAIEAIVLVATEPVPPDLLAQLLELPVATVEQLCQRLAAAYDEAGHGFQLIRVAGGYRYQSHPDLAPYVERFVLEGQSARLSAAALETLAIVAYKQPISRAQVAAIRGVDPDAVLRTLQSRGYVDQVGRDPGPGQAVLWGTTPQLLERLGLDSVADLPPVTNFVPGADVVEALEAGLRVEPVLIEDLDPADDHADDHADDRTGGPSGEGPSGDGA
jgi:segregation and condensation protein B